MSYKVENLEKSMVKLTIEVSAEEFEKAMEKSYAKNKGKMSIQGFRKGKAPRKMLEKMYGPQVFYEDAVNFIIPDAYEEAAEDSKLDIVSRPEIDVVDIGKDKPFIFAATVAVKPEVVLGEYKGLKVEKKEIKVTAADVNAEIDKVREQNARMVSIDTRGIEEDDIAIIDFEGFVDGEPFEGGKGESYELTIGSHSFIDTFEEQLIGKKTGDEVDVNVTFPEDYHAEALKGKPALFKVKINEIKNKELPKADDDFASEVSEFETLKDYKASIKKELTEKKKSEAKSEKEEEVVKLAVNNASMEIPEPMIDEQVNQMMKEFNGRLQQQGMNMEQYMQLTGMDSAAFSEQMKPEAVKRIESRLVLEAIVAAEGIKADEEDIKKEIEDMASMYKMESDKLKEIISDKEREHIAEDMAVKKAVEFLVKESVEE